MVNLVAYIPVPNRQYLEWIGRHVGNELFLISQSLAESLVPRLVRNMGAVSTRYVADMIRAVFPRQYPKLLFYPEGQLIRILVVGQKWVMPDEDVCHIFAERYLLTVGCEVEFESIWARWDMSAVKAKQPVVPSVIESQDKIDLMRMKIARDIKDKSPDCWRQIGAVVFNENECIVCGFNTHKPNEYETVIFGDPALNRDAGTGEFDITLALHAEESVITACAKRGIKLEGASIYVTTFPCPRCARLIAASGFSKLFFEEGYSDLRAQETLSSHDVEIIRVVK